MHKIVKKFPHGDILNFHLIFRLEYVLYVNPITEITTVHMHQRTSKCSLTHMHAHSVSVPRFIASIFGVGLALSILYTGILQNEQYI